LDNGDGTATLAGVPTETGDFPVELTVRQVLDPSQKDTQSFTISVAKAAATVTLSKSERNPHWHRTHGNRHNDSRRLDGGHYLQWLLHSTNGRRQLCGGSYY